MTAPDDLATTIGNLCERLAGMLRDGTTTVADARTLVSTIREAEGWLISARNFLDPEQPDPGAA